MHGALAHRRTAHGSSSVRAKRDDKKIVTVAEITNIVDVLHREDGKAGGNFDGKLVPEK